MVNELTILTSVHVLAAAIWVGGAFVLNVAMWLAATTIGLAYLGPKGGQAARAIEQGAGSPPPGSRNWVPLVGRLNTLLLVAILVIMVIKPT